MIKRERKHPQKYLVSFLPLNQRNIFLDTEFRRVVQWNK